MSGAVLQAADALQFILGGNAIFTLASLKTAQRYTYRVRQSEDRPTVYFVSLLTGPDNTGDYTYLGMIIDRQFTLTRASKMTADSIPVVAFEWTFKRLLTLRDLTGVEIWHVGRCGRCGRTLTVPDSIACGFGPECAGKIA